MYGCAQPAMTCERAPWSTVQAEREKQLPNSRTSYQRKNILLIFKNKPILHSYVVFHYFYLRTSMNINDSRIFQTYTKWR